ncbi:MAG: iron ABC transporter permease [Bacteroidales bacterium]|nr:iron ABC transporter permease [Bacteroidales bacterium]
MKPTLLTLLVALLFAANLLVGSTMECDSFIILSLRLPAALTALVAGAALAGGGLVMQTLFRNPLADPSILGVSAGAGLGAAIALLIFGSFALSAGFAFVGAMAVIALLTAASSWVRGTSGLLIVGIMLSFLVSSATTLLNFFATAEGVRSFIIWGMGDFSGVTGQRLALYAVGAMAVIALFPLAIKPLDALLLGTDYARSLGIDAHRWRTILLVAVGWLTALTTAACGPIAFLGLAVPHGARLFMGTATHRSLLPATLLLGSATALACLLLTHVPAALGLTHSVMPLSALTPLLGAPIVIYILIKN